MCNFVYLAGRFWVNQMMQKSKQQKPDVVVLGGGRFGCLAVDRLGKRVAMVVEKSSTPYLYKKDVKVIEADAVETAVSLLREDSLPKWLVPAVPVHFLAKWLFLELDFLQPEIMPLPEMDLADITSVINGKENQLYFSMADFLCPDDCPEPLDHCFHTGRKRKFQLFERLAAINSPGWQNATLRSHQLAPGVGGFKAEKLLEIRAKIIAHPGKWLIASACRCHGVLQGMAFKPSREI